VADRLSDAHPELPLDCDVERRRSSDAGPPYRQPVLVCLVFVGGAAGTLARWAVGVAVPHVLRVPLATLAVNVVGAFVLGALLEHLAGRGRNPAGGVGGRPPQESGRRRALRVLLGTGFCGGFTTYSALANDTGTLLRDGLVGHAVAYVAATLVLGFAASALGVTVGRRRTAPRATA
jgi:fluoride exporter